MISKDKRFLIVGLGLMGGSYAKGLTKAGYYVGAIDTNQSSIDYAIENRIIQSGQVEVNREYISSFDIVIFALYPHDFISWISFYQDFLKYGVIISDVTGVKKAIVGKIQSILRNDLEFIATHPMAGREVSGVENADESLFYQANYIIVPTDKNSEYGISTAKDIGEILKFKNISYLSVEEHDEMIGFLSQLTHCIAVSLMTSKESEKLVLYTGDSFRDLTRIAKINENMWCELFLLNKEELIKQMDDFIKEFIKLKEAINNEDEQTIKDMMRLSTYRRGFFDKKK